jgi:hypothetical protein|tara:strand:- start:1246 stop:1434 length:189 start_codon:yes stop_codon:yes gene_type:complete
MFNFNHLEEVELNYFKHCKRALRFSIILIFLAFAALIHAILPFVFHKTVSTLVKDMNKQFNN